MPMVRFFLETLIMQGEAQSDSLRPIHYHHDDPSNATSTSSTGKIQKLAARWVMNDNTETPRPSSNMNTHKKKNWQPSHKHHNRLDTQKPSTCLHHIVIMLRKNFNGGHCIHSLRFLPALEAATRPTPTSSSTNHQCHLAKHSTNSELCSNS